MSRDLSYMLDEPNEDQRCGFVAIVGRPNVGKSTLMNNILGQKLSITSRKPQTTRHQIVGIKTEGDVQAVYVDTPGLHKDQDKAINRYMNKAASSALRDVDVVVFIIDRTAWTEEDQIVFDKVQGAKCPVVLVINKIDQLEDKESLLPHLAELSQKMDFLDIVPISAKNGTSVDRLEAVINEQLPKSMHFYPEDQVTDRSSRFLAAELVREKLMRNLGDEIPYGTTVEIEEFRRSETGTLIISALILVERQGQKRIVIGDKGAKIKGIGRDARLDMERMFDSKVMLNLWVKVRSNWSDDERALRSLGYNDID
ncbi:MAG: GTPase Era [Amphritea sp.]|nr:GTPase Era [Amphritea sp.]